MTTCVGLASAVFAAVLSATPGERPTATPGAPAAPGTAGMGAIETGYVIAKARYVPPPYSLEVSGTDVLLNGHVVSEVPSRRRPSGPGGWTVRGRFGGPFRAVESQAGAKLGRIAHWLRYGAALIIPGDGPLYVIPADDAIWAMQLLNSDRPREERAAYLADSNHAPSPREREVWTGLVDHYVQSKELRTRLQEEMAPFAEASGGDEFWTGLGRYALNVGGMSLVVLAFGALLSRQPPGACTCHTCERCGNGSSFVLRNMGLVLVLSAFDLGCTLLAGGTGQMAELNPFADPLVGSPGVLAAFKLSATMVGATILVGLRQHRRAQVASWWLCLVCALLTLRWVAFHSLVVA